MRLCDQWKFPPFFRPQWQSPCTALTADKCCARGLWKSLADWGQFYQQIFHHNSNSMKNSFSYPSCRDVIAMKFCTWHDSCAVMPCAKFCSDITPCDGVTLKPIEFELRWKSHPWNWPLALILSVGLCGTQIYIILQSCGTQIYIILQSCGIQIYIILQYCCISWYDSFFF